MSRVKALRALGPRDRRELLAAIGRGRVVRLATGSCWRYAGTPGGFAAGTGTAGKVPVARRHLERLVVDGLVRLGPSDVWELTYAGTIEAAGGAA